MHDCGLNEYSDWDHEEFNDAFNGFLGLIKRRKSNDMPMFAMNAAVPASKDWV